MAQFRGTIQGNRGRASRLGTKNSGLSVSANGWHIGVRVELDHVDSKDIATVYLTGGSSGRNMKSRELGRFVEGENGTEPS